MGDGGGTNSNTHLDSSCIIIIDFIDMKAEEHRAQVLRTLEKEIA
eukprot:gene31205-41579_t